MSNTKPSAAIIAAINSSDKGYISYDDMMDHIMANNPTFARQNVQMALSNALKRDFVRLERLNGVKHYALGDKVMANSRSVNVNQYGRIVKDYENGKGSPISGLDEAVLAMFDGLKYPVTSKQAFDVFVAMQPKMAGHKYAFDNALTRLSTGKDPDRQIGKTKDSMSDDNTNARAMYHFGSVELIRKLKAKFAQVL